jgi:hypothetical protein
MMNNKKFRAPPTTPPTSQIHYDHQRSNKSKNFKPKPLKTTQNSSANNERLRSLHYKDVLLRRLIALLIISQMNSAGARPCKALILSGGGDLGAYEAGVLYGLAISLPKEEIDWDVVAGK